MEERDRVHKQERDAQAARSMGVDEAVAAEMQTAAIEKLTTIALDERMHDGLARRPPVCPIRKGQEKDKDAVHAALVLRKQDAWGGNFQYLGWYESV